ncbi:right-handed parallel beta-helix repeat-containing protein [Chloroflexota bacterium]
MIYIHSDSPTPGQFDWNRFEFVNGILSYARVENYRQLGSNSWHPDNFTISHSILGNVGGYAIGVSEGTALIEHNTLFNAAHELIYICFGSQAIIRNNHIGPNPVEQGISICADPTAAPHVYNNVIEGNKWGVRFTTPPVAPVFEGNVFINNEVDWHHHY